MWTGHPDDVADQVDVLAYAAWEATKVTGPDVGAVGFYVPRPSRPQVRHVRHVSHRETICSL